MQSLRWQAIWFIFRPALQPWHIALCRNVTVITTRPLKSTNMATTYHNVDLMGLINRHSATESPESAGVLIRTEKRNLKLEQLKCLNVN